VFGTVLQQLLRLEKFVILAGRLFHMLVTRLLKKVRMTELELHRRLYGCPRSCDWALGMKKASLINTNIIHNKLITYSDLYIAPATGAKYCDQRVCVSLSLFVCPLAYLRNHTT